MAIRKLRPADPSHKSAGSVGMCLIERSAYFLLTLTIAIAATSYNWRLAEAKPITVISAEVERYIEADLKRRFPSAKFGQKWSDGLSHEISIAQSFGSIFLYPRSFDAGTFGIVVQVAAGRFVSDPSGTIRISRVLALGAGSEEDQVTLLQQDIQYSGPSWVGDPQASRLYWVSSAGTRSVDSYVAVSPGRAPATPVGMVREYSVELIAKSFIRPVVFQGIYTVEAGILAAITNAAFSENPNSPDAVAQDYRLWSRTSLKLRCVGSKIDRLEAQSSEIQSGFEPTGIPYFNMEAKSEIDVPLRIYNDPGDDPTLIRRFEFGMKGRPNRATLATFYVHNWRSCAWIWHRITGVVSCETDPATTRANLEGSRFPSHRLWLNGRLEDTNVQGPFESLWSCDPKDASRVR